MYCPMREGGLYGPEPPLLWIWWHYVCFCRSSIVTVLHIDPSMLCGAYHWDTTFLVFRLLVLESIPLSACVCFLVIGVCEGSFCAGHYV